jgi:hypothetical protein
VAMYQYADQISTNIYISAVEKVEARLGIMRDYNPNLDNF